MEIYDILIIAFLLIFAITGFKRGLFKSLVMFVGFIVVVILSYNFKNYIGDIFTLNFPFFKLGGIASLNIVMYQTIAFIIVFAILLLAYRILVTITGVFEKILKYTIVLGIPSKLLGAVIGFLEGYILLYIILFFLNQPFINLNLKENSNYATGILEKTPIISSYTEKTLEIFKEVSALGKEDSNTLDLKIMDLILKNKITSKEVVQKLIESDKINIEGIENIVNKY